jgi:hypothetical protein
MILGDRQKLEKLLNDCGRAVNANNGRCALIEDALVDCLGLLTDILSAELPDTIVGEVSKVWPDNQDPKNIRDTLATRFERIVWTNSLRGFDLASWQFRQWVDSSGDGGYRLNETIIAVFARRSDTTRNGVASRG